MIKNAVEAFTGYIQVQHHEYWDEKTIEHTFAETGNLTQKIRDVKNVDLIVPRLQSFALASSGDQTKGAMVMGVDPVKETQLTGLKEKIVRYRLSERAVQELEKENLPDALMKKIRELKHNSYANTHKLELDLELEDEEAKKYTPVITKHTKFRGNYLESNDKGALVADKLAKYLKIDINDTIILLGQGYHGVSAAGKYPVRGILKFPTPDLDRSMVYLTLEQAQNLYGAHNRLTCLALNLHDHDDESMKKTADRISKAVDNEQFSVLSWKQMNKALVQQIESDNISGLMMLGMLYIIIAFGVFGTVLMMTAERKREFGVMVAIGMQKLKLGGVVTAEMFFIGILGLISGIILSIPAIMLGYYNPIRLTGETAKSIESFGIEPVMPFAWFDDYIFNQSLIVMLLVLIAIIYPIYSVVKINETKALRA